MRLRLFFVIFLIACPAHAIQIINNSSKAIQVKVNGYEAELKGGSIADLPSKVKPPYQMTLIRQNNKGEIVVCQRKAYASDILVLPEQCKWVPQSEIVSPQGVAVGAEAPKPSR